MVLPIAEPGGGAALDMGAEIAAALASQGWCVTPGFLEDGLVECLGAELHAAWAAGRFRQAGVGRGRHWQLRPEVRTDRVLWLDEGGRTPAQRAYLQRLESLRQAVNRVASLGLFEFEGHFAVYSPGAYYRKHRDQFLDLGTRKVSCILYLNTQWRLEWGGTLRLFLGADGGEPHVDVPPAGGTLVTFLTRDFYHEVLPTTRDRYSITGWFRCRDAGAS